MSARRLAHQPALDGIRGIAVLGVLLFHGELLDGGYLGVDTFFVLSGFLITALLLREIDDAARVDLRAFWARRARRLAPALFVTLLATVGYMLFLATPGERASIRGDGVATLLYVANWREIVRSADYFAIFADPSPLDHTWSLAIEEQFYLAWPLLFWLIARRPKHHAARNVAVLSAGGWLASVASSAWWYRESGAQRVYYGTDTRIASMFAGALLAAWFTVRGGTRSRGSRIALEVVACASIVALGAAWTTVRGDDALLYQGGLVASAIGVALVIAAAVDPKRGLVCKVFSWSPLRNLGLVSYGVYLYHWPVFLWIDDSRFDLGPIPLFALRCTCTLAFAIPSYLFIERPVRSGFGTRKLWRRVTPAVALATVAALFAPPTPASRAIADYQGTGGILVVGDSVAHTMFPGFVVNELRSSLVHVPGCRLLAGEITVESQFAGSCDWRTKWSAALQQRDPSVVVVVIGTWDMFDIRLDGSESIVAPGEPEWDEAFAATVGEVIDLLHGDDRQVVFPQIPCVSPEGSLDFDDRSAANVERIRIANEIIRDEVAVRANFAASPDLYARLCPRDRYEESIDGVGIVRYDGVHFTAEGSRSTVRWLLPYLQDRVPNVDLSVDADAMAVLVYGGAMTRDADATIRSRLDAAGIDAIVRAGPGLTLCDFVSLLPDDLGAHHPDVVVLEPALFGISGCTGLMFGLDTEGLDEARLRQLEAFLRDATLAGSRVLVVVPPVPKQIRDRDALERFLTGAEQIFGRYDGVVVTGAAREALGGSAFRRRVACQPSESRRPDLCEDGTAEVRSPDGWNLCAAPDPVIGFPQPCSPDAPGVIRFADSVVTATVALLGVRSPPTDAPRGSG